MTELFKYHLRISLPNRKLKLDPLDVEYICAYLWFEYKISVDQLYTELGKYGGTHAHAIARSMVKISYTKLKQMGGYSLYWKLIDSDAYLKHVETYIKKNTFITQPSVKEQFSIELKSSPEEDE